jgi:hypothetical protein
MLFKPALKHRAGLQLQMDKCARTPIVQGKLTSCEGVITEAACFKNMLLFHSSHTLF